MYISKIRECSTYRETLLKQGENRRNIKLNLWGCKHEKTFSTLLWYLRMFYERSL